MGGGRRGRCADQMILNRPVWGPGLDVRRISFPCLSSGFTAATLTYSACLFVTERHQERRRNLWKRCVRRRSRPSEAQTVRRGETPVLRSGAAAARGACYMWTGVYSHELVVYAAQTESAIEQRHQLSLCWQLCEAAHRHNSAPS